MLVCCCNIIEQREHDSWVCVTGMMSTCDFLRDPDSQKDIASVVSKLGLKMLKQKNST